MAGGQYLRQTGTSTPSPASGWTVFQVADMATEPANTVLAGPIIGADAVPTFRVLSSADVPAGIITNVQIVTNTILYSNIQQVGAHSLLGNSTASTANAQEITLGAGLSFSSTTLVATGPRIFTAILGQGAPITAGTNSAGNYLICSFAGTFTRWDAAVPTATQPSGASLVVDVLKSADHGSTWTSIWNSTPSNRPTITTGTNNAGGTAFDTTTYAAGDWLRFDVITAGGGAVQNATIQIASRMNQ